MPRFTKPEKLMADELNRRKISFRSHDYQLSGRPDFILDDVRIAIFVHGCYHHRHSGCRKSRSPRANALTWMATFWDTVARDQRNVAALTSTGWWVFIAWECELLADAAAVSERLQNWHQRRISQLSEGFLNNPNVAAESPEISDNQ